MKKFYLQPGWEIIPRELGAELRPLANNLKPLFLENCREVPSMMGLFEALRKGISIKSVLPGYKDVLSQLVGHGVVMVRNQPTVTEKSGGYLDRLNRYCVGPDKIVHSISTITHSGAMTTSEAIGLSSRLIKYQPTLNYGWGADPGAEMAEIKAIVECTERFALSDYNLENFRQATWKDMEKYSLTTSELNTSATTLRNAGLIEWGKLDELDGMGFIYAPLDFLHHPVDYWFLGRLPVCPMDISGVAGHQTKGAATVNAILELCEHEALMVTWFGKRRTPTIKRESMDSTSKVLIKLLERKDWRIIIKDISLDLAPVVMAVGIGPSGKRALTIGSSAAFSSRYAIKKAVLEVARTILMDESRPTEHTNIEGENVNDISTHAQYYSSHKHLEQVKWLWEEGEEVEAKDLLTHGRLKGQPLGSVAKLWGRSRHPEKLEVAYLAGILKQARLSAYTCDITPTAVKKSPLALRIVRVVVPKITRMVVGYNLKPAPTVRYRSLLKKYCANQQTTVLAKVHPFS